MKTERKKREKSQKAKRPLIDLDPFSHPTKTGAVAGAGVFIANHWDFIENAYKSDIGILIRSAPILGLAFGTYSMISYNFVKMFGKYKGVNKLKTFMRFHELSKKLDHCELDSQEFEDTLHSLEDCVHEGTNFHNYISAMARIDKGDRLRGIDDMLRHARNQRRSDDIVPNSLFSSINAHATYYTSAMMHRLFNRNGGHEDKVNQLYKELLHTLHSRGNEELTRKALDKILEYSSDLEDRIVFGAVLDYKLNSRSGEHWNPFLDMIDNMVKSAQSEGLEAYIDNVTEGRNEVFRLSKAYMKRFDDGEKLEMEVENLKDTFIDLDHVLSHGAPAEIDGGFYYITPASGDNLFNSLKGMGSDERYSVLQQALENLADIVKTAEQREDLIPFAAEEYTSRIRLLEDIGLDRYFFDLWDESISQRLTSMTQAYYKDANPKNFLKEDDHLFEIDFEGRRKKAAGIDLVNILEFERVYGNDISEELKDVYADILNSKGFHISISDEEFNICRAQRHLELIGYRMRDFHRTENPAHLTYQRYHMASAIEALDKLSDHRDYAVLSEELDKSFSAL